MNKALRVAMLVALCGMPTTLSVLVAAPADSPVADAAMRADAATVRTLVAQGADVQTAQADGMTALHWAAMRSDLEMAETLIYAGANLDAATRLGQHTPLHVASKSGHETVVKALLTAGSDPHATTASGTTPLHLAAQAGNAEAVAALLDGGADVNARESTWGQTPLMFAAAFNRIGPVNVLMERGADFEIATKVVDLPALDAVDRAAAQRRQAVLDGFRAAAPSSAQQGWQPSASQVQAAIRAAREVQAFPETAREDGADGRLSRGTPRAYTERVGTQGGLTALLHAARQGYTDVALALLYAGADINHVNGDHTSPLQIATMNGHFDLALRLVERGADPNIVTDAGASPLFAALNRQPTTAVGASGALPPTQSARPAAGHISRCHEGGARGRGGSERAADETLVVHVVQPLLLGECGWSNAILASGVCHRRRGDEATHGLRRGPQRANEGPRATTP